MEKKNMVLLTVIAVATLLVAVVGATFAYFTATITDNREEEGTPGEAAITASKTPGSLTIDKSDAGFGSFNDENVYPGHKALVQLKVTSSESNTDTYFDIVYKGTNGFPENKIKFDIYESTEEIGIEAQNAYTCTKKSEPTGSDGQYKLYEDCQLNNQLKLTSGAHIIHTELLKTSTNTVKLNGEHPFLITGGTEKTMYYYVVVTYVNDENADQNTGEQGQSLTGNISIEIAPNDPDAIKDTDTQKLTTKNS